MFKWRSERTKITAVFKLQFHATQIFEYGGSGLVVSVVPAENGKPTARLEKSTVRENGCYWENQIYETVKLIQDPKTGKIQERIYYFLILTGSPKSSLVGEFSVNIADYVGATKACSVSFPFKNSNSDSYLHVSIQRVQENSNHGRVQRDLEENDGLRVKEDEDKSLRRHFSNGDAEQAAMSNPIEDLPLRKTVSHTVGLNGTRRGSNGSDITLSSSDSSSGLNTPREVGVRNINTVKDQTSNSSGYQDEQKTQWDLAIVPVNDSSTDYSMNSPRDFFPSLRSPMGLDDSSDMLKADLVALSRRAEVSELELQTLRKQIVKESKKGQDMLREITSLKEERNALKDECEKLKSSRKRSDDLNVKSKFQFQGDPWTLVELIREELSYEKDMNANLRIQLQKTQDSNNELMLAVQDLEEMLEKNEKGVSHLPNRSTSGESAIEIEESIQKSQSDDDEAQKALEDLVRQHSDAQGTYLLEQKVMDLCSEIEMYRRDKDELEIQMEQLALDYEILKQENHEYYTRLEQSHLQDQLKMQCDGTSSYTAARELEAQIQKLEDELHENSEELSHCLAEIKDLEARNTSLEERLQKQAEEYETEIKDISHSRMEQQQRAARAEADLNESGAIINELETVIEKLKKEHKKHLEDLSSSSAAIEELEANNYNLEVELEKQAQRYEADIEALVHAKTEQEQRALKAEESAANSSAAVNELEAHIKKLENELKRHSEVSSDNLASVKELEAHIQNLEEEIEKQAEGFEADLESVTRAKVEQEQRAIRAEEALRLMRWKNANTAARIQDEFKRLSSQMQSSFDANEKVASKALTEATELRQQNRYLQDMLQKGHEELESAKDEYETKLHELYGQLNMKSIQVEQMEAEIAEKSKQVEIQIKQSDELQRSVSAEKLDHTSELERLTSENKSLAEQMKELTKERDLLVQRENTARDNSVKEVAGKSLEELIVLRNLKNEKEQAITSLKFEVEELKAQCGNLQHSLYEDEKEKEKLRKQVFQLKADLKKKDEAILSVEKKFNENGRAIAQDKPRGTSKNTKSERNLKEVGSKEVITLKERIKLLEGHIKSKDAALETSTNAFLTKEKSLQKKIEEMEIRLGELSQSNQGVGHDEVKQVSVGIQVVCNSEEVTLGNMPEEASISDETSNKMELNSDSQRESDGRQKPSDIDSGDQQKIDVLLKEMILLKEQNKSMEIELNEMQERYSEISLKFAEVEGERQQLIMRVRNLKNAKKG
ncbi:paramyosin-like isoform X2 [Chenopodium quinoa]|uniref:paramyosin-like isoform X2 n=1 Tax=Chenopodium quinoa TaxID=63459 RepID=UPI000B79A5AD|nr:paramyosin-like isoform X2 [Chenopodium quinoa]